MRLLFVCTGNLCRSPVAAGLTESWLARTAPGVLGEVLGEVDVRSAGTDAPTGEPMHRASAAALRRLGGDPGDRRAVPVTAELASGADLVLTMTRRHRRAVLELAPRGLRRTFTLLEAADLLRGVDARGLLHLPVDVRARELGLRLDARRAHRTGSGADDVADPIGRRPSVHHDVAQTIDRALRPLLGALFPAGGAHPSRSGDLHREGAPIPAA